MRPPTDDAHVRDDEAEEQSEEPAQEEPKPAHRHAPDQRTERPDEPERSQEPRQPEGPLEQVAASLAETTAEKAAAVIDELDEQLRRALADLDNLRKRFDREVRREQAVERVRVLREVLPAIDDLERAIQHAEADPRAILAGVKVVRDRLVAVLERLGFPRFEDVGARFDPNRHEAVGVVESDGPAGSVVEAVRPGYGTEEDVLRPAGVLVAREQG
jgi:molecular chaperone GrpE